MVATRSSGTLLAAIGLVAGLFSALFGVGGGIVIVPLLMVLARFPGRLATGTSLAVIVFTAVFGTVAFGALGEVDWLIAAEVGLPAAAGALAGTALQQRLSSRVLVLAFSAFLAAVAIRLLVT